MVAWVRNLADWFQRFFVWFVRDIHRAWIALLVPPLVFWLWGAIVTGEQQLRLTGMFLELAGLATVALGLRDTAKLFDRPSLRVLVVQWWGRRPTWRRHVVIGALSGHASLRGLSASGVLTSGPSPTATVEERLQALENGLNKAHANIAATQTRIDMETKTRNEALEAERRVRESGDEKSKQLIEKAKAGGLYLEAMGVLWLALGIILATASGEIARRLG